MTSMAYRKNVSFPDEKFCRAALKQAEVRAEERPSRVHPGAGAQLFSWYLRWLIEEDRKRLERSGKL